MLKEHAPHGPVTELRLLDADFVTRKRRMTQHREFRGRQSTEISEGREEAIVVSTECTLSSEGHPGRARACKDDVAQQGREQ